MNGRAYDSETFNNENGIFISKIGDVTNRREVKTLGKSYSYGVYKTKRETLKR